MREAKAPEETVRLVARSTVYRGTGSLPFQPGEHFDAPRSHADDLVKGEHAETPEDRETRLRADAAQAEANAKAAEGEAQHAEASAAADEHQAPA